MSILASYRQIDLRGIPDACLHIIYSVPKFAPLARVPARARISPETRRAPGLVA